MRYSERKRGTIVDGLERVRLFTSSEKAVVVVIVELKHQSKIQ